MRPRIVWRVTRPASVVWAVLTVVLSGVAVWTVVLLSEIARDADVTRDVMARHFAPPHPSVLYARPTADGWEISIDGRSVLDDERLLLDPSGILVRQVDWSWLPRSHAPRRS